ncbi:MAG: adenine deaminase [Spirochaetaceae bacterium]|jgi:adenine deaminase|nr:adenine deaminase [Spirochaetaceae bacterium]
MITKEKLKKLIDTAAGRINADTVIRGGTIADIYGCRLIQGDIALSDGLIAGIGDYKGDTIIDADGMYILPGFIDSHIHIESSHLSPEEFGRILTPCGTTSVIADPHEIVNVCGLAGFDYMIRAAKETALDIKFMLPSCVPATKWEHSGAVINAKDMEPEILRENVLGLGEFMDYPGVVGAFDTVLDKILVAKKAGKIIDGHSPGLDNKALSAYIAAGITTDHECSTVSEMLDRIERGAFVLIRQGSTCHDLRKLIKGITPENSRRCLLCSDDRHPKTIFEEGHIDAHLRICVEEGLDPMTAIRMATLNIAECYRLYDRGAIAPGLRADLAFVDNLRDFHVQKTMINGILAAEKGRYLLPVRRCDDRVVRGSFRVKDFSLKKLELPLESENVYVIDLHPGSIVTGKAKAKVKRDNNGLFVYDPALDIVKIAVVERHQNTGNVAKALIRGYGIKSGAVAISIAHDSHNIITLGVNDADMHRAVEQLIEQGGGIVLVKDGSVLEQIPMPLGGIMSDQSGEWLYKKLNAAHETAQKELGVNTLIDPFMSLCFMSLPVIPELKITDMGLFDVEQFDFIPLEVS